MKRIAVNLMLLGSIFASPALLGCDRTVSEEKTVKENPNGSTEVKHEKTVEKSDGTIEKRTEKDVQK